MTEAKLPTKTKLQAFDPRLGDIWKKGALGKVQYTFPDTKLAVRFLFRLNQFRRAAEHDKHPDAVLFRRAKGSRSGTVVTLQPADFEFEVLFDHVAPTPEKLPGDVGGRLTPMTEQDKQERTEGKFSESDSPVSVDDLLGDLKKGNF